MSTDGRMREIMAVARQERSVPQRPAPVTAR